MDDEQLQRLPIQDNEDLIQEHINGRISAPVGGAGRYFTIKVSVLLLYLLGVACGFWPTIQLTIVSIAAMTEFWLAKNVDGLELVGMRWSHEIGDSGDPRWVFYSRRDPYVPEPANSNVFWSGLFGGCILWLCITFWAMFDFTTMNTLIALFVLVLHSTNLAGFLACHSVSTKQADDVARSVLLGDNFESDKLEIEEDKEIPELNDGNLEIQIDNVEKLENDI
ncbi:hypothetical protein TRFO_12913 [Tritrichomonas foetus]|uniref:Golgi apparatus membrane protein TVP23 homolog n=1 Tax=Tritrichomonas foetus TaxID=1144522 RepID=A0A1J4L4C4_9EUKA|nr:hypothetical protein TRFO_12913 [Tritrichomonas foetus]|eukprot:OHT16828.1 hypothetical protein TRFO_12913 [Tritrichomonas foetus]